SYFGKGDEITGDMYWVNEISGGDMKLTTTGTGDVLITNGNVGIGTTSPQKLLHVGSGSAAANVLIDSNAGPSMLLQIASTNKWEVGVNTNFGTDGLFFYHHAGTPGYGFGISTLGNATLQGCLNYNSGTLGSCLSDSQVKTNVNAYTSIGLDEIVGLHPVTYQYNGLGGTMADGVVRTGLIAEEVQAVAPGLVTTVYQKLNPTDATTTALLKVDYGALTFGLINSIKELNARTSFIESAATSTVLTVDVAGNVGIGTTSPQHRLTVSGDVAAEAFVNNSSRELKTDITDLATTTENTILEQLETTNVYTYHYKDEPTTNPLRIGLIVDTAPQEVLSVSGDGVDIYKLAAFTLAGVKAQGRKIDAIDTRVGVVEQAIADLKAAASAVADAAADAVAGAGDSVASTTSSTISSLAALLDGLKSLGVDIAQNLAHFVKVVADNFQVGSAEHPTGITMYDKSTGEPYCFQVDNGAATTTPGTCTDIIIPLTQTASAATTDLAVRPPSDGSDTTPPVITLNGNNPANITVGDTYGDLGATVTDNVSQNLGIYASLDGGATTTPEQIIVDTSIAGEHTILFSATDQAGNTGTATRTVNVLSPLSIIDIGTYEVPTTTDATSTPTTDTATTTTDIVTSTTP
ncbi:MAG: tail fiber domain-containing protein, partial [bacterium]|nr:tail fiber domain-containing protein [bacterium]